MQWFCVAMKKKPQTTFLVVTASNTYAYSWSKGLSRGLKAFF